MKSVFFATVLLFSFVSVQHVQAHTLETDTSVGAVLHITPEDDPVVGEITDFFFDIKDKTNKFVPADCDCIASILQGGQEVYSQPLFQSSVNPSMQDASFSYTFPERNVYTIRISGKPRSQGSFEPFTLEWDQRVARISTNPEAAASEQKTPDIWRWVFSGLGIGGFGLFIYYFSSRSAKAKDKLGRS